MTDEQTRANIAANVRRLRGEQSRYALAKAVGIHTIQVSRIERAINVPSPGLLSRLAQAFSVTVDDLISTPRILQNSR